MMYEHSVSLAADIWRGLDESTQTALLQKTSQWGGSLKELMRNSEEDAQIGITLADESCLDVFAEIVVPVIERYHGKVFDPDNHPNRLEYSGKPRQLDSSYCKSVRARLLYNLEEYPFAMKEEHFGLRDALLNMVEEKFSLLENTPYQGSFAYVTDMSETERQELRSRGELFQEAGRFSKNLGSSDGWPAGQAVFTADNASLAAWIGEEDHIRLISKHQGGDITAATETLLDAASYLDAEEGWAKKGNCFVAACPTNCGTGLRVSAMLELPVAAHLQMDTLRSIAEKYNLQIRGTGGEHTEMQAGRFEISFRGRMGYTADEICEALYEGASEMISLEKSLGTFSSKILEETFSRKKYQLEEKQVSSLG